MNIKHTKRAGVDHTPEASDRGDSWRWKGSGRPYIGVEGRAIQKRKCPMQVTGPMRWREPQR